MTLPPMARLAADWGAREPRPHGKRHRAHGHEPPAILSRNVLGSNPGSSALTRSNLNVGFESTLVDVQATRGSSTTARPARGRAAGRWSHPHSTLHIFCGGPLMKCTGGVSMTPPSVASPVVPRPPPPPGARAARPAAAPSAAAAPATAAGSARGSVASLSLCTTAHPPHPPDYHKIIGTFP
jgi:hypothetical protein